MVYDGGVKDQGGEATGNRANPSASSSKSDLDKKLGVRHPLKHKRFRAGGKKMADPTSSGVEEEEMSTTSEGDVVAPGGADAAAQERSDPEEDDVGYKSGGWKR
jgi:protein phosphatase 1L